VPQQLVIQIPDQMNQAFLLRALYCVVRRVKVGHQYAREILEHSFNSATFPGWAIEKGHLFHAGEHPNKAIPANDMRTRFVNVQKASATQSVQQAIICTGVRLRRYCLKFISCTA
jgi:hypothetical protein